jgi:hypothetical protein
MKKQQAKQIGFLIGQLPSSSPSMDPSVSGQSLIPTSGGLTELIENGQKLMGLYQQFSPMIKQIQPLLQQLGSSPTPTPVHYEVEEDRKKGYMTPSKGRRKKRKKRGSTRRRSY